MKNLKILLLTIFAVIGFNSCQDDDDLVFTAAPEAEFTFVNTFLEDYVLNANAASNIAERFVFNSANFNTPSPVNYVLENSILGDFTDAVSVGSSTTTNEIPVTVGQLLEKATMAGIGEDESGALSFRIKAYLGDEDTATEFSYTPIQIINVTIPSQGTGGSGIEISSWGVVGSGYNNWGSGGPDGVFYTTSEPGVIVSYVSLITGEIKFRENNEWGSDLGDATGDGVLDADPDNNISVTEGDYKITIDTNNNNYTIEEFSWGIVGSGYNDWGGAGPDAKFYYDYTTDTFKVGVKLIDGEIKVRPNNTWGGDLGDANGDGVLDTDADNNIAVTEGHYLMTINLNDNSYTLESSDTVWGIVGSGYNDWGGAGPDFALTEIQPNIFVGDVAPLVDGEIKFRKNNDWGGDLGDANGDNVLDADPDNNISVTAGGYRVRIDFNDNSYQLNKIN